MKQSFLLLTVILGYSASAQNWDLTGNTGTNSNIHFIGTTDKQNLVFRLANKERMRINRQGRITFFAVNTTGPVLNKNLFLGGGLDNPLAFYNTVLGLGSLTANANGEGNTAMGNNVMSILSSGNFNTGLGTSALLQGNSGSENVAVGAQAMQGEGAMDQNTAIGYAALARFSANGFDFITGNTAVGQNTLIKLRTGEWNSALGSNVLPLLQGGSDNIGIGESAGVNLGGGNNNIFIGTQTTAFSSTSKYELNIGNWIVGVGGTIGIGSFTQPLPADGVAQDGGTYKLFVKDGIKTEKIKVDIAASNGWADYVFKKDYQLRTLAEVESFIHNNGHLPEVPSTEEAIRNGVELKAMNILLLKKIEELTLYGIGQQKRVKALEQKMASKKH